MQEKPMSEIRVYPGTVIDGGGSKVVFTLTPIIGETREEYEHRCHEVFKLAVSFVAPSGPTFEVADTSRYRKVGEHSYEIITHGYKPQEEAGNERDSHFQGFAKLLWEEMLSQTQGHYIDVTAGHIPLHHPEDDEHKPYIDLIARRAYDLVWHALYCNGIDASYRPGKDYRPTVFYEREVTEHTNEIPDLTEWPK